MVGPHVLTIRIRTKRIEDFQGLETEGGLFSRLFRVFRVNFTHFVGSFVASFVEIDHDSEQIACRRRIDERVHAETKNRLMRPASSSPDSFRRSSRQSSRQRFVQSFVIIRLRSFGATSRHVRLRSFGATSRHVRLRSFGASSRQDLRGVQGGRLRWSLPGARGSGSALVI